MAVWPINLPEIRHLTGINCKNGRTGFPGLTFLHFSPGGMVIDYILEIIHRNSKLWVR
jgi:hypothetical protein